MKIRNGFVSNSSSSSFIVVGRPAKSNRVRSAKLTKDQVKTAIKELKESDLYLEKQWYDDPEDEATRKRIDALTETTELYITEFVSGADDIGYDDMLNDPEAIPFHNGGHGSPYDPDSYYELDDDVWFPKTEDEMRGEGYRVCPNCNYSFKEEDE